MNNWKQPVTFTVDAVTRVNNKQRNLRALHSTLLRLVSIFKKTVGFVWQLTLFFVPTFADQITLTGNISTYEVAW